MIIINDKRSIIKNKNKNIKEKVLAITKGIAIGIATGYIFVIVFIK